MSISMTHEYALLFQHLRQENPHPTESRFLLRNPIEVNEIVVLTVILSIPLYFK